MNMNNMQEREVIKSDFYLVDGVVKSTDSSTMGKEAGVSDSTKVSLTKESLTLFSQKPIGQENLAVNNAPSGMSMPSEHVNKFVTGDFAPASPSVIAPEPVNNSLGNVASVSQVPEATTQQTIEPLITPSIPEPSVEPQIPVPTSEPRFNVDIPIIGDAQKTDASASLNTLEPAGGVSEQVINEPVFESVTNAGVQGTVEPKLENPAIGNVVPTVGNAPAMESIPAVESAPAMESVPAVESIPAVESAPAMESIPAVESAPAMESIPAVESAPVMESIPAVESTPVMESTPVVEASGNDFSDKDLEDLKATLNSLKESLSKKMKTATDFAILLGAFKEDIAKIDEIENKVSDLALKNKSQETTQLVGESELDAAINRGFDKVDLATQSQVQFGQPSVQAPTAETIAQPRM